ncbi:MAG: adenylate/guanylate cyclase domain-containing protein, partial [Pseudomonadota bacterium]
KLGLFDLEWGTVCPLCGAITNSVADLDQVAEDSLHCALCNRPAASVLDDTIEVMFAYTPPGSSLDLHGDFAAYHQYHTSSSFPYQQDWLSYHARHTAAELKLEPGGTASWALDIQPGVTYRLLCLDTHSSAVVRVAEGSSASQPAALTLSASGFSAPAARLPAPSAAIAMTNLTEQRVWFRLLRVDMDDVMAILDQGPPQFGPRVTGKHLLNNQAFRDNFALHELASDLKLKLRSLTLLFTDLKGSTALYDREGDLAAYRLVQDHFGALKQVVRTHSGAVIKTMGDAVMAAFPSAQEGTAAAIEMMAAMGEITGAKREGDIGLKVGLHAGPALAINAGTNLDYFGQTVNIAARVQGLADAGEICLTGALNGSEAVPAILADAGYAGQPELARLKGVAAEERVYRYRQVA